MFVAECFAVQDAILAAIQKDIRWIIIHFDSLAVVNSINGRIEVSKDIINLVEDVTCLLTHFSYSRLEYCNRVIKVDADALTKRTYLYSLCCTLPPSIFFFEKQKKKHGFMYTCGIILNKANSVKGSLGFLSLDPLSLMHIL